MAVRRFIMMLPGLLLAACGAPAGGSGASPNPPPPTIPIINPVTPGPAPTVLASVPEGASAARTPAPPGTAAAGTPGLAILHQGWLQQGQPLTVGLVMENTNRHVSYEQVRYTATLSAADGRVVGSVTGTILLLLPGMEVGVVASGRATAEVVTMDLVVAAGRAIPSEPPALPLFATRQIQYVAQPPHVTGVLMNNMVRDARAIQVTAIAYAADGRIVGAGSHILDSVHARSEIPVSVPLVSADIPARVELWASITPDSFSASGP